MIKQLSSLDWEEYKNIRLEALQQVPIAFTASFEEESTWTEQQFKETLTKNTIFASIHNSRIVGMAGFYRLDLLKTNHKGILWGVYLQPEFRGKGLANKLIKTVITYAAPRVLQLHLSVASINISAKKCYERHGFKNYGTEPDCLKIDDQFYDEDFMVLKIEDISR